MLTRALAILGLLGIMSFSAVGAHAERRVALVVGNAHYEHANTLRNPLNDAHDIATLLKSLGFEVLLGTDLDQQKLADDIDQFARMLDGADVGLFYYAGHGLQMNGKNYLISTQAKLENEFLIPAETVELDTIMQLMESHARLNLIFLDACRNNPLADRLRQSLISAKRSVSLGRGLARVEPSSRDTLIAFAAAPGQEAADGRGRNSPFTAALLENMPKPGLEVSVMLKEVAAKVRRETDNAQRQRTTATYEDWTVRCETPPSNPSNKLCEMVQTTQMQGQATPVTQIAIGRPTKSEPLRLVMQVPVNVWLATAAKLVYDDKLPSLTAAFTRCVPIGCFANIALKDDIVKRMRERAEAGHLDFKDSTQRDVTVPVSFKGFGTAFDALMKE